jgi:hypothetical protein
MRTPLLAAQVPDRLLPVTTGPARRCPGGPEVMHWRCAWDAGWNSAPAHGGFAIASLLLILVVAVAAALLARAAARRMRGARQ